MDMIWIVLLLLLNGGISWWNAYVCGRHWDETRILGGFPRLVIWSAAIMSAAGFSMILMALLSFVVSVTGYMPPEGVELMMNFWYVMAVPPILGSGFIIMIHSWIMAWRERNFLNIGVAGWNTYAQISNTISAFSGLGKAFEKIGDAFSGADEKAKLALVALLLAIISILGGTLLTAILIQKYRENPAPLPAEFQPQKAVR